jgi:hypothetical protein
MEAPKHTDLKVQQVIPRTDIKQLVRFHKWAEGLVSGNLPPALKSRSPLLKASFVIDLCGYRNPYNLLCSGLTQDPSSYGRTGSGSNVTAVSRHGATGMQAEMATSGQNLHCRIHRGKT